MMAESFLAGLAEWSIRAAALAGAAGVILVALRIRGAHARLTVWTMVLAGALLAPLVTPFGRPLALTLPAFPWRGLERAASSDGAGWPRMLDLSRNRTATASMNAVDGGSSRSAEAAVALWAGVALAMLLRLAVGLHLSQRLASRSAVIEGDLRESPQVNVPITVGLLHPVILLPAGWREWSEDTLRAVIAHERSHVARRDPLRLLAASIYRSLAWFHPLAWWLHAHLAALAEAASDDIAIATIQDPVAYAGTLVGFLRRASHRVQWEGIAMGSPAQRARRVERVLDSNRQLSRPLSAGAVAAWLGAFIPLAYLASSARVIKAQTPAPPAISVCGGDPVYQAWLTTDAVYIITGDERRAFERLGSAAECGQFVEQFWERRDPTPGTPQNEYKEEHYRRIAYANQHFASMLPGWKADRGRTYITYGPPDEIESHPHGEQDGRTGPPFEEWRYRWIDGVGDDIFFKFLDRTLDGAFPMVFMGSGAQRAALAGGAVGADSVFGPVDGVSLRVNRDRTLLLTLPRKPGNRSMTLKILDSSERNAAPSAPVEIPAMNQPSTGGQSIDFNWNGVSLPPGSYRLVVEFNQMDPHAPSDGNRRELPFEVK